MITEPAKRLSISGIPIRDQHSMAALESRFYQFICTGGCTATHRERKPTVDADLNPIIRVPIGYPEEARPQRTR